MRQRKPYNPNSAYGRRKLREQAAYNYANATPEEKAARDEIGCWVWAIVLAIVIIIGIIGFSSGNEKGFLKWLSR